MAPTREDCEYCKEKEKIAPLNMEVVKKIIVSTDTYNIVTHGKAIKNHIEWKDLEIQRKQLIASRPEQIVRE